MKMARPIWLQISIAVVVTLAALLHNTRTPALESVSAGHRLAEAWCTDCHSIEAANAGAKSNPRISRQ
jgi:cytochrome c2